MPRAFRLSVLLGVVALALANEVGETADTFEELGPAAAEIRTLDFQAWNRVQAALERLRDAGIDVEPLRRHGGEPTDSGS